MEGFIYSCLSEQSWKIRNMAGDSAISLRQRQYRELLAIYRVSTWNIAQPLTHGSN